MPRLPLSPLCRLGLVVGAALLAAIWWRAIVWYPVLPDPIPVHFDFNGQPDRWAAKSVPSWFMLPALATAMAVVFGGVALMIRRMALNAPGLINMPRKKLFVELSPEGRAAVMGPTRTYLVWTTVAITGLFLWIVEASARVALQEMAAMAIWPVFAVVGLILFGLLPYIATTARVVELMAERERSGA